MAFCFQFTTHTSTNGASHLLIGTFVPCQYFRVALQLHFLRRSSACVLLVSVEQQRFEREALLRGPLQVQRHPLVQP